MAKYTVEYSVNAVATPSGSILTTKKVEKIDGNISDIKEMSIEQVWKFIFPEDNVYGTLGPDIRKATDLVSSLLEDKKIKESERALLLRAITRTQL